MLRLDAVMFAVATASPAPRGYVAPTEVVAEDVEVPTGEPESRPEPTRASPSKPQQSTAKPVSPPTPAGDIVGPTLAQPRGGLARDDPRRGYDGPPRRFGGGLLVLGALATTATTVAGGVVRSPPVAILGWVVGPPILAGGAATIARRKVYEEIWIAGKTPRDLRVREVVAWSSFAAGLGFSIAAALVITTPRSGAADDAILDPLLCGNACGGLYAAMWIVGTLSSAVALPLASHATAYRRRVDDLRLLRGRATKSGLGDAAFGELGPPRFAGTARIVTGAALLAGAALVIPNVVGWGGDAGGVLGTGALAAGLVGIGTTLVVTGARARRRANRWRDAAMSAAISPTLAPTFLGLSLRGRS